MIALTPADLIVRPQQITHISPTKSKLYALSTKTGHVYALPTTSTLQLPPGQSPTDPPRKASYSIFQTLDPLHWFTSRAPSTQPIDFVRLDVATDTKLGLGRREKIKQISAGRDHLLALTTKGRVLGHAVNESANVNLQMVDLEEIVLPRPTTVNREQEKKNERFNLM